jgi:hypothetical protein
MATREEFVKACGGIDAAMRLETTILSIGNEFLPQEARDVRDRKVEPTEAYWTWLLSQMPDEAP